MAQSPKLTATEKSSTINPDFQLDVRLRVSFAEWEMFVKCRDAFHHFVQYWEAQNIVFDYVHIDTYNKAGFVEADEEVTVTVDVPA